MFKERRTLPEHLISKFSALQMDDGWGEWGGGGGGWSSINFIAIVHDAAPGDLPTNTAYNLPYALLIQRRSTELYICRG